MLLKHENPAMPDYFEFVYTVLMHSVNIFICKMEKRSDDTWRL